MPCERIDLGEGTFAIVCARGRGARPKPCIVCRKDSARLCDGVLPKPSGGTRVCSVALCLDHAVRLGSGSDYCPDCAAARGLTLHAPAPDVGAEGYDLDTPKYLTLVSGSRSLVDRSGGEAWGRHWIECFVDHAETLVTGDAPGPDTWAREAMARTTIPCAVYALDGSIQDAHGKVIGRWARPEQVPGRSDPQRKVWPLTRNRVMVQAVYTRGQQGRLVDIEALHDPKSPTNGTLHTASVARRLGLTANVRQFGRDT